MRVARFTEFVILLGLGAYKACGSGTDCATPAVVSGG